MKILGRIMIILVVFVGLGSLMTVAVNVGRTMPMFGNDTPDEAQFRLQNSGQGQSTPSQPERVSPSKDGGDGRRGGNPGVRWVLAFGKNLTILAVLVVGIVLPKSIARKKKKPALLSRQ